MTARKRTRKAAKSATRTPSKKPAKVHDLPARNADSVRGGSFLSDVAKQISGAGSTVSR